MPTNHKAQKSYIFAVGQENSTHEKVFFEDVEVTMKSDQNQRCKKERFVNFQVQNTAQRWPIFKLNKISDLDKSACYDDEDILLYCISMISNSVTGAALIKEAGKLGWSVSLDDLRGCDFHLDVPEKHLILDNNGLSGAALSKSLYFSNLMLVSFIRGLRDIWQEKRHGGFEEHFEPESILLLERIRAADCDVLTILLAWELRNQGASALWRHILASEEGDIALAFSNYLEKNQNALTDGSALIEAFNQWFVCNIRISACDHETLNYLDNVIQNSAKSRPFGRRKAEAVDIEILSCLPDRTAYLRRQGRQILSNPLYFGLNNEINQSHFMHIMRDMKVTCIHDVPFRDAVLADMIFPNGEFTPDFEVLRETQR